MSLFYIYLATNTLGIEQFGYFAIIVALGQMISGLTNFQTWQFIIRWGANGAGAREAIGFAVALDMPVHDHADKLERLREIDFGPKTEVAEGAVIDIGGRLFVISVATAEFSCQGQKVMGISPQAPLYQALEGLSAGDTADVNGRAVTIEGLF